MELSPVPSLPDRIFYWSGPRLSVFHSNNTLFSSVLCDIHEERNQIEIDICKGY